VTPEQVRDALRGDLPPATLVLGPGARMLVLGALPEYGWRDLDADAARQIRAEAYLAAPSGLRVIVACLDGASLRVQNMLLKVMEEPPPSTRFVLAAVKHPLPTVVSRCRVLVIGQEVAREEPDPRDKTAVATAVRAARSGQSSLLAQALRSWVPAQARLLSVWAAEAASGQWAVFSSDTVPGVSPEQAMRLLAELARYPGAKLGALAALESVFSPG
jgi:hypothetical protein